MPTSQTVIRKAASEEGWKRISIMTHIDEYRRDGYLVKVSYDKAGNVGDVVCQTPVTHRRYRLDSNTRGAVLAQLRSRVTV